MRRWVTLAPLWLLLAAGCSFQANTRLPPAGLPERIDIAAPGGSPRPLMAAVYPLLDPPDTRGVGGQAAEILFRELLAAGVFASLALEQPARPLSREETIADAREKGYPVVILGQVRHYFEGSRYQAARVEQEIEVLAFDLGAVRTLWRAGAMESVPPAREKDWILVTVEGDPAPSCRQLMERNAAKFRLMMTTP
jgi:hypothetical protein